MYRLGTALRSVGELESETPRATAAEKARHAKAARHVDRAMELLSEARRVRKLRLAKASLMEAEEGDEPEQEEKPNKWKEAAQNPVYTKLQKEKKSVQQAVFGGEGAKAAAAAEGEDEVDDEMEDETGMDKKLLVPVHLRNEPPRWQRLLLVSNRMKESMVMCDSALVDVAVIRIDWARDSLDDVWERIQHRLFMFRSRCKVLSIGLVAPAKPGRIALVEGDKISLVGIEKPRVSRFLERLTSVIAPKVEHAYAHGGRLDLLNFQGADEDGHTLMQKLRHRFKIADVIGSTNAMRPEGHRALESEGMRAAKLYFNLEKLGRWVIMPGELIYKKEEVRWTSLPPTAKVAMASKAIEKDEAEDKAGAKGKIGFNVVAKQVRSMGKAFAAYQRQRAKTAQQERAEANTKGGKSGGGGGVDKRNLTTTGTPTSTATMETPSQPTTTTVRFGDSTTTTPATATPSRLRAPASITSTSPGSILKLGNDVNSRPGASPSLYAPSEAGQSSATVAVDIPDDMRDMSTLVEDNEGGEAAKPAAKKTLAGIFQKAVRGVTAAMRFQKSLPDPPTVTLLIDMDPEKFKNTASQRYFLNELSIELDISDARLSVKSYDSYTGAVVVQVMPRQGETPPDMVINRLETMIADETMMLDPDFGDITFVEKYIPDRYGPQRRQAMVGDADAAAAAAAAASAAAASSPRAKPQATHLRPKCDRVLLVSNRVVNPSLALAAARENVAAVFFDYRFATLDKIIYDVHHRMQEHGKTTTVKSIGLLTQWKPGSFGLVKGFRTSLKNLAKPELRGFWSQMASLLEPGSGRIDFLGADARGCRSTKRLLIDLSEMTRHAVTTAGSEVMVEHGPAGFLVDLGSGLNPYDNSINSKGTADLYFDPEKIKAWRSAVAENGSPFVEAERPRAREVNVSMSVVTSAVRWMKKSGVKRGGNKDGGKAAGLDKEAAAVHRSAAAKAEMQLTEGGLAERAYVPPLPLVQFADERRPILMTSNLDDLPVDPVLADIGVAIDDEPTIVPRLEIEVARARNAPRGSASRIEDDMAGEDVGEELQLIVEEMKSRKKLDLPPVVRMDDQVRKMQAYEQTGIWAHNSRALR